MNWIYFLWALGYESVWVVLVPGHLTELLFPARREQLWLRTRGFMITSVIFVIGARMAWYGWTQRARVMIFHMPPYSPPTLYIAGAIGAIGLLIFAAYVVPHSPRRSGLNRHTAPAPWMVGLIVTVLGTPWAAYVLLGFGSLPDVPFPFALVGDWRGASSP